MSSSTQAMEQPAARRLLLVDDDEVFRERLARAMRSRGLVVDTAQDHHSALRCMRDLGSYWAAVVDLRMPGHDGIELVRLLLDVDRSIRVAVLTGYGSIATAIEAIRAGAHDYLTKPADADQILTALEAEAEPDAGGIDDAASSGEHLAPSLARVEWEHIQRVLTDCDNNISQAARVLGIHRRSLQRKLAKYPPRR